MQEQENFFTLECMKETEERGKNEKENIFFHELISALKRR